ncbi:ATP-binding protein [Nocardiopsis potens]|uniref:ATP-binding protein n=1 Tax=Nocardiopsis potens TaxID=1246458 RepID=UPI00034B7349|nr:ATP-binding protein [Nocardiopsis potens]
MTATLTAPRLPEVTLPLMDLVPPGQRHYFVDRPGPAHFKRRRYDFGCSRQLMPLVRAFLSTCAAEYGPDYRHLFTLLGSELANNALEHTASGLPGGTYTLLCHRRRDGLHLTCRDSGARDGRRASLREREHLRPDPVGLDPGSQGGRGLALIDALATSWGDNGLVFYRQVWFFLDRDLTGSAWTTC